MGVVKKLRRGSRMRFKTHERNRPLIERRHSSAETGGRWVKIETDL